MATFGLDGQPPRPPGEPRPDWWRFILTIAFVILVTWLLYLWHPRPKDDADLDCREDPGNIEAPFNECFVKGFQAGLKARK